MNEQWKLSYFCFKPTGIILFPGTKCSLDIVVHPENFSCLVDSNVVMSSMFVVAVWDSSAKSPVGLLTGTSQQFGDFDECLEVRHPVSSQYCLLTVTLPVPPGHDSLDPQTEFYPPTTSMWDKIYVS